MDLTISRQNCSTMASSMPLSCSSIGSREPASAGAVGGAHSANLPAFASTEATDRKWPVCSGG